MKDIDLEQLKKICRTSQFGPQMGYAETVSSESLLLKPYNLKECKVQTVNSLDPSALIQAEKVVVTSETLNKVTEVLS